MAKKCGLNGDEDPCFNPNPGGAKLDRLLDSNPGGPLLVPVMFRSRSCPLPADESWLFPPPVKELEPEATRELEPEARIEPPMEELATWYCPE